MTVPQAIACGRLPYERRSTLNPIEPPWYGSVCPVVGEGWHREVSPHPDYGWLATVPEMRGRSPPLCQERALAAR